jgi:hypothetical protein
MNDRQTENCKRKVRYASEAEARAAVAQQLRLNPGGPRLRVYECPVCGGWHMTSGSRGLDDKLRRAFEGGD